MKIFFTIVILISSQSPAAQGKGIPMEQIRDRGQSPAWNRLLFYTPRLARPETSLVDSPEFFLSKHGSRDPIAELQSMLYALEQPLAEHLDEDVRCKFPARTAFVYQNFPDIKIDEIICPKYEEWIHELPIEKVSLVFATNYLNNPASLFGHTFLRLHRAKTEKTFSSPALLDFAVNFAANPTTDNPFLYSVYGLIGVFPGSFSLMPYFLKVQEYNNAESRDLIEYELNWNQDDIRRLLNVLWEVGPQRINYFYFDENCSYIMLSVVDAVSPHWDLLGRLALVTAPSDSVKALASEEGNVRSINVRASLYSRLRSLIADLGPSEVSLIKRSFAKKRIDRGLSRLSSARQALTSDAFIELLDFKTKTFGHKLPDDPDMANLRSQLLSTRAKLGIVSPVRDSMDFRSAPHLGHWSQFVSASQGWNDNRQAFSDLGLRMTLHDLGSPDLGYSQDLEIEMGNLRFRIQTDESSHPAIKLHKYDLFKVHSIPDYHPLLNPLAWSFSLGGDRKTFTTCMDHFAQGGAGLASTVFFAKLLIIPEARIESQCDKSYKPKILIGPKLGVLTSLHKTKLSIMGIPFWVMSGQKPEYQPQLEVTLAHLHSMRWETRIGTQVHHRVSEFSVEIRHYF